MTTSAPKRALFKKAHHISGIVLSVFIGFHLLNHLFALTGPDAHIRLMEAFRRVYRHPVAETLLLAATAFQVITGLRLLFSRNARLPAEKIQVYSGLYLSFFLSVHVSAVLMGRYVEGLDTNFYFAAAGLNLFPAGLCFVPYYFLAVSAISLHVAALHYLRTKSVKVSYAIAGSGILASVLILLGFTNFFHGYDMPAEYRQFIEGFFGK